jgi:23S rRNA (uracil1939-C5)-methyltransferase
MSKRRFKKISDVPIQVTIEKMDHDGRGIATVDGKITFVTGALPGETVMMRYTEQKGRYAEGRMIEVLQASPDRIPAKCAVYGICGGCVLQHLGPEKQIQYKQTVLAEQLLHFGKVQPAHWLPPVQADSWGYRLKARLGVRHVSAKGSVLIGFREQNGRFLTDMNACEILPPSVGPHIGEWREVFSTLDAAREIPQIEVALDDHRTALIIRHLVPLSEKDLQILTQFGEQRGLWIYLQPKGPDTVHLLWPKVREPMSYCLPNHNIEIQFEPGDFTQVNMGVNRKMVDRAIELLQLQQSDRVLDLFCGLGNFSLPIARHAGYVVGVEGDEPMVVRALANARHNDIHHAEFFAANLFEITGQEPFLQKGFNKVLLDPPRAGAETAVRVLGEMSSVERIVYVSCNPATLARDVGILVHEHRFTFEQAGVLDMFPHTSHVESIVVLIKRKR